MATASAAVVTAGHRWRWEARTSQAQRLQRQGTRPQQASGVSRLHTAAWHAQPTVLHSALALSAIVCLRTSLYDDGARPRLRESGRVGLLLQGADECPSARRALLAQRQTLAPPQRLRRELGRVRHGARSGSNPTRGDQARSRSGIGLGGGRSQWGRPGRARLASSPSLAVERSVSPVSVSHTREWTGATGTSAPLDKRSGRAEG